LINAPEKSIAVLPVENISPNKDDAYFADSVPDEILNNLAKIAQLKVISRTSVMQYRGDNKRDLRQIAGALGVANVLEGTVRREGNHVRVSTELADARNDNTIWADSYDRDFKAFTLRPDLPEVHLAMASHRYYCYRDFERASVQVAIAAQVLPNNPDLLNLSALINRIQGRWEVAVADLEKATILDPGNLEFLGNVAVTYKWLRRYRDAERILDQLVALDPEQPQFLSKKKLNAYSEKADVKGARAAFEALLSSMKNDPGITGWHVYLAMCAAPLKNWGGTSCL
jgi:TolB-like protein